MDEEEKTNNPTAKRSSSGSFELFLYAALDQFLLFFIVSPSALLVWRGSWRLFDILLFPDQLLLSAWVSICIGYSFIILTFLFLELKNTKWRLFEKRLEWKMFTYPLSVSVLHAWRGGWMLMDIYIPTNGYSLLWTHIASFITVSITRSGSNTLFMPAFFASDAMAVPFQIGTVFGTRMSTKSSFGYKILDYLITLTVIPTAAVMFWRSLWTAINVYLFPMHETFSNMVSIMAGYTIIASFKLVNSILKLQVARCPKALAFFLQCAYCYTMGFASINIWRGTWQMIDIFVYPEHPLMVAFVSHAVGIILLYVCGASTNLIGSPCGTRVDCLETLSAFDTMLGTILPRPKRLTEEKESLVVGDKDDQTIELEVVTKIPECRNGLCSSS